MSSILSYQKWLIVRVALLMLMMGILIHGAIYLYQNSVVIPQIKEGEQAKADVLLEAYLPVISEAIQSGEEQEIQLLLSKLQLMSNPATGEPLVDGLVVETVDGSDWIRSEPVDIARSFLAEAIIFSAGEVRQMVGFANLYYSREYFEQLEEEAIDSLFQLSLLMTVLSALVLAILAYYLRPLQTLAQSLQEWGVGDNPSKLPEPTTSASQEILLVHSAISRLLDDLHSYQVSLEDLVEERTEDLQTANQTLEEAHHRITSQNEAFATLTKIDSVNTPLQTALEEITSTAAATLEVERVSIWLYQDEGTTLRCIDLYECSRGEHSSGAILNVAEFSAYFNAMSEERALVVPDVETDSRTSELSKIYLQPLQIKSMLDTPIYVGNQPIGVVCNESVGVHHHWTIDEENFAISVADFVALAMESDQRRQVEETLRRHRDHLEELVEERTGELRIANEKLKEEMKIREKLEKAEQYNAFQSGIAEMSATILHNIGNVITGMQGSVDKSSRNVTTCTKIAKTVRLMQTRFDGGELDEKAMGRGLTLVADSIEKATGDEGISEQLGKLKTGIFHIGEIISVYQSASKMEVNATRFNLQTMLKDSMQLIQDKLDKYRVGYEIICPADLEMTIPRNPAIQALLNLTKNSVEAILDRRDRQHSHSGKIEIRASKLDEKMVELVVEDDGCGIEEDAQTKIFNHGYTSKSYGSGYGLHSAANFVNSIGGSINVESDGHDQGALMRLVLPVVDRREQKRVEKEQ